MSSNLGSLTVDVIAKVGAFVDGLSKAERESKKFKANVEKNLKAVGTAFVGLSLAGAAATAALIKSSIDSADALLEQSQMFGVSVELLSSYKLGLEQAGSSSEDFATGLKGLANAVDADAEAFKRLQISTKNADGSLKGSNELLEEIAGRFASMEDGITKTALAQDLFGKSGIKLIPFLNQGADGLANMRDEAERLGLVISQETAEAADQFNDNLLTLKGIIRGTGNELAAALLPKLVEFSDLLKDPSVQQGIKDIVTGIADMAIAAAKFVGEIPTIIDFMRELSGFGNDDFAGLNKQLDDVRNKLAQFEPNQQWGEFYENLRKQEADLLAQIKTVEEAYVARQKVASTGSTTGTTPPTVFNAGASGSDKDAKQAADEWKKEMEDALDKAEQAMGKIQAIDDARMQLNAGMEREIALYGETSQAAILAYDLAHGELSALNEETKAYSISLAEQLDLEKKKAEQAANDEQFEATAAGLEKQIALLGDTSKAAEMLYDIEHGGYEQFTADQQDKLLLLAQELEEREKMLKEFEEAEKAKAEIMEEFLKNTQNILADFLFDPFEDGLDGMVKSFSNMLKRMAAEAVAADIMKYFVSAAGGSSGGGGWISAIASAFAGAKDGGGSIGAGQWGIVGEVGPEIVRGPAMVTSRKDTAAMLAGNKNNYNITNVFPGVTSAREAPMAGAAAAQATLAGLERIQRMR